MLLAVVRLELTTDEFRTGPLTTTFGGDNLRKVIRDLLRFRSSLLKLTLNLTIVEHPVSSERGRRDWKPWAPERAVGFKAPPTYETSPLGECGVAFKPLSHCPRL
jgi:hypothetical protein